MAKEIAILQSAVFEKKVQIMRSSELHTTAVSTERDQIPDSH